jgi:hypothetical protein
MNVYSGKIKDDPYYFTVIGKDIEDALKQCTGDIASAESVQSIEFIVEYDSYERAVSWANCEINGMFHEVSSLAEIADRYRDVNLRLLNQSHGQVANEAHRLRLMADAIMVRVEKIKQYADMIGDLSTDLGIQEKLEEIEAEEKLNQAR